MYDIIIIADHASENIILMKITNLVTISVYFSANEAYESPWRNGENPPPHASYKKTNSNILTDLDKIRPELGVTLDIW